MASNSAPKHGLDRSITILVVEDDASLRKLLGRSLEKLSYNVFTCRTALEALDIFTNESIDLILLDIMLPGMDGFGLCALVRTLSDIPIIAITSLTATEDVVKMLEIGADDYITKPFNFGVLEVRIEAQLRRLAPTSRLNTIGVLRAGNFELNSRKRVAKIGHQEVKLSQRECSLLHCLMSEPGIPISINRLYEHVWGQCNGQEKSMVPNVIQRLRTKLEADPVKPSLIVNVRGYGYKFSTPS